MSFAILFAEIGRQKLGRKRQKKGKCFLCLAGGSVLFGLCKILDRVDWRGVKLNDDVE